MSNLNDQSKQQSIHEYLDLPHRAWNVEFEISDFGASLVSLLELPRKIVEMDKKTIFWSFLKRFLQGCEISFILRNYNSNDTNHESIELALIGYWETQQIAIPLWILNDLLLGFEIISTEKFIVLDSEPLNWKSSLPTSIQTSISHTTEKETLIITEKTFLNDKIYFQIKYSDITISEHFDEIQFFDRIAQTIIPELDGNEED